MNKAIRARTSQHVCEETAQKFYKEGIEIGKIIWGSAWKIQESDMEKIPESDFARAKREYIEAKIKFVNTTHQLAQFGGLMLEINQQYLSDLESDMKIKAKQFMEYESQLFDLIWSGLDRV